MDNNVKLIEQREVMGKDFKIYGDYENPLFLAKDVAEWINHSNSRVMIKSIDENEKVVNNVSTLGGEQETWFVTEDGLYEVLMQSRKPIAKEFKRQVKAILKDIRKHGMYAKEDLLNDPDLLIQTAISLKNEKARINQLETEMQEMKPKVVYHDRILNCDNLYSTTQVAKDFGKTAQWLNKYLKNIGVQYKRSDMWVLYDEYARRGFACSKTHIITDDCGNEIAKMHTYWTSIGRYFIYQKLRSDGFLPVTENSL